MKRLEHWNSTSHEERHTLQVLPLSYSKVLWLSEMARSLDLRRHRKGGARVHVLRRGIRRLPLYHGEYDRYSGTAWFLSCSGDDASA